MIKYRIGLYLYGLNTLDIKTNIGQNMQGDEMVANAWKKYLERLDNVEYVKLYSNQNKCDDNNLTHMIYFNPMLNENDKYPYGKNILYFQNAFPSSVYDGGTIGIFNKYKNNFDGYIFLSDKIKKECNTDGCVIPFATDLELLNYCYDQKYEHDISFLGNDIRGIEENEKYFIPATKFNFAIYSKSEWNQPLAKYRIGTLSFEDTKLLYSSSKINLNIHLADHLKYGCINSRIYDILACKSFVLSDYFQELEDIFDDSIGYTIGNSDEIYKINYFLENKDIRLLKAKKGYNIIKSNHTYKQRTNILINYLKEI